MLDLNQSISRLILLDTVHITHIKLMVLFNFFFLYTEVSYLWHRLCFPVNTDIIKPTLKLSTTEKKKEI